MRLMRGATGFRVSGEDALPLTDVALLRQLCFEAARSVAGRVGMWREAGTSTFHSTTITSRRVSCSVLFHAHLPVVAFTAAPPLPGQLIGAFMDSPHWAGIFEAGGLQLLGPRALGLKMADVDLGVLSQAELAQISYWRPESLGDLLFNWWD